MYSSFRKISSRLFPICDLTEQSSVFKLGKLNDHIAAIGRKQSIALLRWPRTIIIKIFVKNEDFGVSKFIIPLERQEE
jgi:hypothetical protein